MEISEQKYRKLFQNADQALTHALDVRKFEIDLYWKRATYFWTFIGATLVAYSAIQASNTQASPKQDLSVIFSCLGVLFSFAWHCVNRGSKRWQENWENHVDMLEERSIGPLFKVWLRRRAPVTGKETLQHLLTGPSDISVSGVNQILSLYIVALWLYLLYRSLKPWSIKADVNWEYVALISCTFAVCYALLRWARTYGGSQHHIAELRESHIVSTDAAEASQDPIENPTP